MINHIAHTHCAVNRRDNGHSHCRNILHNLIENQKMDSLQELLTKIELTPLHLQSSNQRQTIDDKSILWTFKYFQTKARHRHVIECLPIWISFLQLGCTPDRGPRVPILICSPGVYGILVPTINWFSEETTRSSPLFPPLGKCRSTPYKGGDCSPNILIDVGKLITFPLSQLLRAKWHNYPQNVFSI